MNTDDKQYWITLVQAPMFAALAAYAIWQDDPMAMGFVIMLLAMPYNREKK